MSRFKKSMLSLVLVMGLVLGVSLPASAINVGKVLNLFSSTIQEIFHSIEKYLSNVTFRVIGQEVVSEDAYGNITFYGEFGPEKTLDKEGNLLREWVYENGKLAQVIEYTDTGKIITYYENGKAQVSEWFPSDIYNSETLENLGLEQGEHGGWITREYHYREDGILEYVKEFTLESVDEETEGAQEITIGNNTFYVKGEWQTTYYDDLGRIDCVKDSDGNLIRDYVYKNGVLDHVDVYGGTDAEGNPTVTARIYYVGGRPDRVVRVENGEELTGEGAVAYVHYDGARIDKITGPGDLIRALGYGVTSDEAGLTLHFNDMGLPDYVENEEGAIIQKWLYSWEIKDMNDDGNIDANDIIAMFGWDPNVDGVEDVANTVLAMKNLGVRLVAVLTLSPKLSGNGSSFDSDMYVSRVNLLGMFAIDTSSFDPEPDPEPESAPAGGDPAVTGEVYQDSQRNWHMRVTAWTNPEKTEWEEVDITLDLSLLGSQDLANIERILADYANSGKNLTLYGLTPTGEISQGCTLQVLGLGKGPFEEHPFDF